MAQTPLYVPTHKENVLQKTLAIVSLVTVEPNVRYLFVLELLVHHRRSVQVVEIVLRIINVHALMDVSVHSVNSTYALELTALILWFVQVAVFVQHLINVFAIMDTEDLHVTRSEERRVGKECR